MAAPLEGVTVIEIDSWMAAPSTGAILADMGANVIKIEPLSGDPMRDMSRPPKLGDDADEGVKGYDYQFDVDNRGKKSVVVALDKPEGVALIHDLVRSAQIFMCNLLSHRQEKFSLDPKSLFAVNPSIVHATLTGYGTTGPDAWRPGYDVTAFFGRSGIYDAMREGDDGDVPMARPAQGDHTTGLALFGGILAALRIAERTGEGQVVETSLYETAVWTQASDYAVTAVDRAPVRKRKRVQQLTATANRYPCGDGKWIVLNMPQTSAWPKLCAALGSNHLMDDERFKEPGLRYRNMAALIEEIDKILLTRSRDEWGKIFDELEIIWGPVLGLHEVADDAQANAIGLFPEIEHPDIGPYRSVNIPMRFATADVKPRGPAPSMGEHTRSVLSEQGVGDERIKDLLAAGVVAESK